MTKNKSCFLVKMSQDQIKYDIILYIVYTYFLYFKITVQFN